MRKVQDGLNEVDSVGEGDGGRGKRAKGRKGARMKSDGERERAFPMESKLIRAYNVQRHFYLPCSEQL